MTVRLLLANPNTTEAVTDLAAARARAVAMAGTEIVPVTARFGAAVIGTRVELAIAEHAALDLVARHAEGCDAVVIAASTDSGVRGARELLGVPVVGLTEASLHMACLLAARFGTVTLSRPSHAILRDQLAASGLAARCVAGVAIDATPQDVLADPDAVAGRVATAVAGLVEQGAEAVVLVGAVMAAFVDRTPSPVPLLEGVACAVTLAEALVRLSLPRLAPGVAARQTVGLDPALAGRLWGRA